MGKRVRRIYLTYASPTQNHLDFVRTAGHMKGDEDAIYVLLREDDSPGGICAKVVSNEPFNYFGSEGKVLTGRRVSPESLRGLDEGTLEAFVRLNKGKLHHRSSWKQGIAMRKQRRRAGRCAGA